LENNFPLYAQLSINQLPDIKPFVSMKRSIKRKLVRAKVALNTTIGKILDINRKRKKLQAYEELAGKEEELSQELKLLNKIADRQAKIIRKYEDSLAQEKVGAS
jgi:hypothetical protein